MRQILILEREEIHTLIRGKVLVLSTGAGEIGVQFEREAVLPPPAPAPESSYGQYGMTKTAKRAALLLDAKGKLECDVCGATTRKDGQPFKSPASVVRHKMMEHSSKGRRIKGRIGRAMTKLGKARAARQEANGHAA